MTTEPLSWDEFSAIAGPNAAAFAQSWSKTSTLRGSLCWPGLFFPIIWLLYRKLYFTAAASVILFMGFNLFIGNSSLFVIGAGAVILFISLAVFLFGEKLYIRAVTSDIRMIDAIAHNDAQRKAYGMKVGGVSHAGAFIGAMITAASLILIGLHIFILFRHG